MTWAENLIGKPWVAGARGPEAFDCWGLLAWVYADRLGVTLPTLGHIDPKNLQAVAAAFVDISPAWQEIPRPVDLCAVAMSQNKRIHHVGIWLDSEKGVLHAMEKSCVIFQGISSLASSGFQTIKYYKIRP